MEWYTTVTGSLLSYQPTFRLTWEWFSLSDAKYGCAKLFPDLMKFLDKCFERRWWIICEDIASLLYYKNSIANADDFFISTKLENGWHCRTFKQIDAVNPQEIFEDQAMLEKNGPRGLLE